MIASNISSYSFCCSIVVISESVFVEYPHENWMDSPKIYLKESNLPIILAQAQEVPMELEKSFYGTTEKKTH